MNIETYAHRINEIRRKWGKKLLILGHYYIPDETIRVTDRQGDSLALSRVAEADGEAEAVVFCGVHFMAETADILLNSPRKMAKRGGTRVPVMLVDAAAGCPMADMAKIEDVEAAWEVIGSRRPPGGGEARMDYLSALLRRPEAGGYLSAATLFYKNWKIF